MCVCETICAVCVCETMGAMYVRVAVFAINTNEHSSSSVWSFRDVLEFQLSATKLELKYFLIKIFNLSLQIF